MIHLKVRTEFSFGATFAPLDRVVARLKAVGATAAGCVDTNGSTWAHVRWERACRESGLAPLFGAEFVVADEPGKTHNSAKAWVLAQEDAQPLYRLATLAGPSHTLSTRQFLDAPGLVKFAGSALAGRPEAGEAGVWFDLTPGASMARRDALASARRAPSHVRLVLVGNNMYPAPQDSVLHELIGDNQTTTPQHILAEPELTAAFSDVLSNEQLRAALNNAATIAALCGDVRLKKAPLIKVEGDVEALCRAGIERRLRTGQLSAWTEEYEARLRRELTLVREKAFESYFLVVADMVRWAKESMLVGPARGSAAGSLMCYLMGITEVDPIPYGLMFERFVDITRKDLPDIDLDFPDNKRDGVYEYLRKTYGADKVARIGSINEFKPKSALAEVAKKLRIPPWETQSVRDAMFERSSGDSRVNNCLTDTLKETQPGRDLLKRYPAISLAGDLEGHASHTGLHAAGVIVCNEPVSNYCTVIDGVAQLDKLDAEALNLLKVDVLGLRTLSVIEDSGVITQDEIYNLKFEDPAVFDLINSGKFSGIFQWEGQALQSLTGQIHVRNFEDMCHITALARPGPLGGGAAGHYGDRHKGIERIDVAHPSMLPYLEETYGLVLYQEQVMRIVREIGQFSWEETSTIRKAMSGRKGKEFFDRLGEKFVAGAATVGLKPPEAQAIWEQINSMGAWAFNKSHSVSYAMVSYWTAWLKAHHPLQYAASALRNAKDDAGAMNILREIVEEGVEYIPFDPALSELTWSVKDGRLVGGFLGLKGIGPVTALKMVQDRARDGVLNADHLARLAKCECVFKDLYPAHAMWRAYYETPEQCGLKRGTRVQRIADLQAGECVFLGKLMSKDSHDHNEAVRLAKRGGKRMTGPTLFLDMRLMDDSTLTPFLCRIDRYDYEPQGRMILERGREEHDWFLIRGEKLKNFPMVQVHKVKCLNNKEFFNETVSNAVSASGQQR